MGDEGRRVSRGCLGRRTFWLVLLVLLVLLLVLLVLCERSPVHDFLHVKEMLQMRMEVELGR